MLRFHFFTTTKGTWVHKNDRGPFNLLIRFLASEASQKKILDFGDADKWVLVTLLETDYFFHCAIEQYYFFKSKSEQGNFFRKNSKPPPEYQMDRALQACVYDVKGNMVD